MKIKTSELVGAALDYAVAKAEGLKVVSNTPAGTYTKERGWFAPTTDWAQGGPIIGRELISIDYDHNVWNAAKYDLDWYISGPTPLIAAMRCFVSSKLGDEVEIPEETL